MSHDIELIEKIENEKLVLYVKEKAKEYIPYSHVTTLLAYRLKFLIDNKTLYDNKGEQYFDFMKQLKRNELVLRTNLYNDKETFTVLFDKEFNKVNINNNHIMNVALILKNRLIHENEDTSVLDALILKIEDWNN